MSIEFNSGSLYIMDCDGEPVKLGDSLDIYMEYEISAKEAESISYQVNQSASFSYELSSIDLSLLEHLSPTTPSDKFMLQYNIIIMCQKRWHKKARVNKKWLKRYGMKPDTVKVLAHATALDCDTSDWSFELDCSDHKYILRSDQQRKGLKMTW